MRCKVNSTAQTLLLDERCFVKIVKTREFVSVLRAVK